MKQLWVLILGMSLVLVLPAKLAQASTLQFDADVNYARSWSEVGNWLPVHLTGLFDPSVSDAAVAAAGGFGPGNVAAFPFSALTFDVGSGPVSAASPSDFFLVSGNPLFFSRPTVGVVTIVTIASDDYWSYFLSTFVSTTNPFIYDALAPNQFLTFDGGSGNQMTIPSSDGSDDFAGVFGWADRASLSVDPDDILPAPEPTSLVTLGTGLLLCVWKSTRRRRLG